MARDPGEIKVTGRTRFRRPVWLAVASLPALAGSVSTVGAPGEPLQAWISRAAIPVRSIDAADEDFSDLEPLASAIGTARVVELGEPSHGAGKLCG